MVVVETPSFIREASNSLTGGERTEVITFLATNPNAGDLIPGTGGARKLRWRASGRGKRGGARVIYYFHDELMPLFLLNVFAKNERSDLTRAEENEIKKLLPRLVDGYKKRKSK